MDIEEQTVSENKNLMETETVLENNTYEQENQSFTLVERLHGVIDKLKKIFGIYGKKD